MGMFDRLGETFIVLRMLRGLSQAELARRAGIRPNQVSRYETGQVLPQLGQLEKILGALDVGLAELLFAMGHLDRTARLLDDRGKLPGEAIARDAVQHYWQEVTDLHLRLSREVLRVVRAGMEGEERSGGPEAEGMRRDPAGGAAFPGDEVGAGAPPPSAASEATADSASSAS